MKLADRPTDMCPVPSLTPNQQAQKAFLDGLQRLKGCVRVAVTGDSVCGQTVQVFVPSLWSDEADQVYDLLRDCLRAHPNSSLNVEVLGLDEMGAADGLINVLPVGALILR